MDNDDLRKLACRLVENQVEMIFTQERMGWIGSSWIIENLVLIVIIDDFTRGG
jgi:hypothetical protein